MYILSRHSQIERKMYYLSLSYVICHWVQIDYQRDGVYMIIMVVPTVS